MRICLPVVAPLALAIVESPARYTVGARFCNSPLGAAKAVAASANSETTFETDNILVNPGYPVLL